MPIDLDTSATLGELMLQVAIEFGMARYPASGPALPNDVNLLALLKSVCNRGYKRFLAADKGWSFAAGHTYTLTLCAEGAASAEVLGGDRSQYRMPSFISGRPKGGWRYRDTRVGLEGPVDVTWESVGRMHQTSPSSSGTPTHCGHKRGEVPDPVLGSRIATIVRFFPTPSEAFVLEGDFRINDHTLVALEERHVAGADHDTAILAACRWEWALSDVERSDTAKRYQDDFELALARSRVIDGDARERYLGVARDTTQPDHQNDRQLGELTYEGQPIP